MTTCPFRTPSTSKKLSTIPIQWARGIEPVLFVADGGKKYLWATTWLSRSGVLPLTIIFNTDVEEYRIGQDDMVRILAERGRICALGFYQSVDETDLEPVLIQVAGRLKTLWTVANQYTFCAPDHTPCELPQLQTLSVTHGIIWRMWSMHELRSLILGSQAEEQEWSVENLRGFFATLEANSRLEELMLCGIGVNDDTWDEILDTPEGHRSPIRLGKLQRLLVEERAFDTDQLPMATVLEATLSLPPGCTRYYHVPNFPRFEPCQVYPVDRLVASLNHFVGTDGTSAFVGSNGTYYGFCEGLPRDAQVQELWLHRTARWEGAGRETSIDDFQTVTKLVIDENISAWLETLKYAFPALKELHLLWQHHTDTQAILRYLTQRKEKGMRVNTLRFVGDPTSDSISFDAFKNDLLEFEHQTNQVIFEEVRTPSGPLFNYLVSTRLGLPEPCKHPSPTSMIWQPWNRYAMLDF